MLSDIELKFFTEVMCYSRIYILKMFKDNNINPHVLYRLIMSDDILKRRDEFYSLFKQEETADIWWSWIANWKLETLDGIYPLKKDDEEC